MKEPSCDAEVAVRMGCQAFRGNLRTPVEKN
jgi:hypothetical protein